MFLQRLIGKCSQQLYCHRPKVETTHMSISRWVGKKFWHLYNGMWLSRKKKDLVVHITMWMTLKTALMSERGQKKRAHTVGLRLSEPIQCRLGRGDTSVGAWAADGERSTTTGERSDPGPRGACPPRRPGGDDFIGAHVYWNLPNCAVKYVQLVMWLLYLSKAAFFKEWIHA